MTSPRSVRFEENVLTRLTRYVATHTGTSLSAVANQFIDEVLRSFEHPGIVFRPGPSGRRAALTSGPDVWEVVETLNILRDHDADLAGDKLVNEVATATGLTERVVRTAVRYYAAFPDEIDEMIAANREAADRAEAAWRAEQAILSNR